jgi:hypothetical protein
MVYEFWSLIDMVSMVDFLLHNEGCMDKCTWGLVVESIKCELLTWRISYQLKELRFTMSISKKHKGEV